MASSEHGGDRPPRGQPTCCSTTAWGRRRASAGCGDLSVAGWGRSRAPWPIAPAGLGRGSADMRKWRRLPFAELTIPTVYDPSLAPPGKHIISAFVQYTPYRLSDGSWDTQKESYADRVLDTIAQYAPNMRDIVVHRQVLTPDDLEREFSLTGGDIFHGEMTPDRLFFLRPVPGWARYRTPVAGLYLCGAGAHPGGGVMGAPGHNAAR